MGASWDAVLVIWGPPDGGPTLEPMLAWDPLPGARTYEIEAAPTPADWESARTVRVSTAGHTYRFSDPNEPGRDDYA